MIERIIIAGSGGQGIMLVGKVLAAAAMRENKHVTWLPAYGPEVRGGTAYCMVTISDREIGSPFIDKADTLIIMNGPSLIKFKNRISRRGISIVNVSLADGRINTILCLKHPFTDIAFGLGNARVANMVALGCYIRNKKIVDKESILRIMEEIAPADKRALIEINKKALSTGMALK